MIVAAAIRKDGKIYALPAPARHHTIIHKYKLGMIPVDDQGFIDSDHGYVRRGPALKIALLNKQIKEGATPHHGLFSEDLW